MYPNIELSVFVLRSEEIVTQLLNNELDLGIGFLPVENEAFESVFLFEEELSLALPSDHVLAHEKELHLKNLTDLPIILLPENYYLRQLIDKYCAKQSIILQPTIEISSLESVVQIVNEGK